LALSDKIGKTKSVITHHILPQFLGITATDHTSDRWSQTKCQRSRRRRWRWAVPSFFCGDG
jgi:hypothetical protein